MKAVSLFSNCGAGDVGYSRAGFQFRVMAELNPNRLSVALANHQSAVGVPGDLRSTWVKVIEKWKNLEGDRRPDLLAACPPCQGMSSARSGLGRHADHNAGGRDPRNLLVTVIKDVALELEPRSIVVENVPAFLTRAVPDPLTGRPISAALLLIEALKDRYHIFAMVADLADWGVPQTRKRCFLTLIHKSELGIIKYSGATAFPAPTHASDWGGEHITIRESLSNLGVASLDSSNRTKAHDPVNPMHFVPVWNERQYRMVSAIPPYSGRGAWLNQECSSCESKTSDLEAAVCEICNSPLLRPVVNRNGSWRLIRGFRSSSYTRMNPDAPASTVTTASGHVGSDKTIHPWENRVLSPYECAHIQTIPSDFVWGDALERWGHTNVREMIGEAVPPKYTEMHGKAISTFLGIGEEVRLLPISDPRVGKGETCIRKAEKVAKYIYRD